MGNLVSSRHWAHIFEALEEEFPEEDEDWLRLGATNKKPIRHRCRDRGYALKEVTHLSDSEFSSMFRMTREGFDVLLGLVSPFMHDTDEAMARIASGGFVTKATKLYATLRFLAGGSYLDIIFAWGVAKATFFSTEPERGIIWPTMEAINHAFTIGLPMDDTEELDKIAAEFARYSHGELKNCVMAIDGWVARTRKPYHSEVDDVMAYRNRHDCWGLVVLAGCDARCRFSMFSCINSGSTNDVTAWELSKMKNLLDQGRLPPKYYIIGDEAFVCTNQLLVPYGGKHLGRWKDSFNYHLSAMRQCIERSFALLVNRWGILWRPLRCAYARWTLVLTVCAKLHNFCLDANIPISQHRFYDDNEEDDALEVLLNDEAVNAALTGGNTATRRTQLTKVLQERGVRRPQFAAMNSREY